MLLSQRLESRQRFIGLGTIGNQTDCVAVANLQQSQLIQAAWVGTLAMLFQHQFRCKRSQNLCQTRRRASVQSMWILYRPTQAFSLAQR
ncbi:hypothetical protein D3C78_1521400 [compost metagenome]